MDCEDEAIITRVYDEFQNALEPSIDLVDEKEPSKEEKINNVSVKSSVCIIP